MYASNAQDAIPTLIDQGDNDQFLADQLQPAVLAEAARQKAWPMTLRIQPGYDHSYYFIASFYRGSPALPCAVFTEVKVRPVRRASSHQKR